MLNIKEAICYASFLNEKISSLQYMLTDTDNCVSVVENHLKSKANPDVEDETIKRENDRIFTCKVSDLAFLLKDLIDEKLELSMAIDSAKANLKIDWDENGTKLSLDSAVEFNKKTRLFTQFGLKPLVDKKTTVSKKFDRDYKFNADGNQVSYNYIVEITSTIDYDKDVVKNMYKGLIARANKISSAIEKAQLEPVVDHTPKYDELASLEDIIADFEKSLNKQA